MRTALLVLLLASPLLQDQPKGKKDADKPPQRGDTIVASGCVDGATFETSDTTGREKGNRYTELLTFRLTGDKKTLEEIRKEHSGHVDTITGELRTDLPRNHPRGKTIGRTRIVVGVGSGRNGMGIEPAPPPMPVLRVTAFEHTGSRCK